MKTSDRTENPYEAPQKFLPTQISAVEFKAIERREKFINYFFLAAIFICFVAALFIDAFSIHSRENQLYPNEHIYNGASLVAGSKFNTWIGFIFITLSLLSRDRYLNLVAMILSLMVTYYISTISARLDYPHTIKFGYFIWIGTFIALALLSALETYRSFKRRKLKSPS